jgi:mono/diheme cytochrome c family protein
MSKANFAGFLLAVALAASPAHAQDGNPENGRLQATRLCADCHEVEPAPGTPATLPGPPFIAVAKTKGMTALALSVWLQTSHPTMPNIMLHPETRADIIAYILMLRKNRP